MNVGIFWNARKIRVSYHSTPPAKQGLCSQNVEMETMSKYWACMQVWPCLSLPCGFTCTMEIIVPALPSSGSIVRYQHWPRTRGISSSLSHVCNLQLGTQFVGTGAGVESSEFPNNLLKVSSMIPGSSLTTQNSRNFGQSNTFGGGGGTSLAE